MPTTTYPDAVHTIALARARRRKARRYRWLALALLGIAAVIAVFCLWR